MSPAPIAHEGRTTTAQSRAEALPPGAEAPLGRLLHAPCVWLATAGGFSLLLVMTTTVISILGRALFDAPLPGDYELVEIGIACAVFAFLPWTQFMRGNIVVELITGGLGPRAKAALDLVADLVFALIAALLTWRTAVGAWDEFEFGITTMRLGIPVWIGFAFGTLCLALLTLICLYTAWRDGWRGLTSADARA